MKMTIEDAPFDNDDNISFQIEDRNKNKDKNKNEDKGKDKNKIITKNENTKTSNNLCEENVNILKTKR